MVNSLTSSNSSSNIRLDLSNLRVYGREKELEELNDVFERSKVQGQAVLLQAPSGVGKTRLIEAFQQQLPANASVCIGHFQPSYTVPHNAIVDCFTELCDRLLDCSPEHVEQCESLEKVLDGDDKKVLINLVPRFQDLFKEVIVPNVDLDILYDWNFNRFQKVIVVVVKTIASNHHPLVMVFDDLQWADEASVRLLRDLAACDVQGFCFVGSYRINETSSEHPVSRYLESSVKMKCLTIGNLPVMACNQLIADTTQLRPALCQPLADIVHKKTSGNAFYIIQFLQLLQEQGSLHYSVKVFSWQWNLSRIEEETEVTDNVAENLLANKIKTMPNSTMHALMMAAAIGSSFGVELLASVCSAHDALEGSTMNPSSTVQVLALQKEELISSLTIAVDGQMITYRPSDQTYKFSHTRIQQASYSLIPEAQRARLHLLIGKMLWKMLQSSSNGNEWLVVMAAGQLNKGKTLLLDQKSKDRLAKLNLEAAKAVIQKSAFFLAAVYLRTGIDLLGEDRWKTNYDITLAITSTLAEITYSIGVHDECHLLVDEVLANSRSLGDSLRVQFTRIEYLGSEKQLSEALDQGFILLGKFGQYFPSKPNKVHVGVCILKTKRMLRGKTDDFLVSLPRCEDDSAIAVMKTLTLIASFCYVSGRKEHVALVGLRMMQMTLRYGLTDCSCHGFALYGAVVGLLGMIKDAYRFGRLALLLYDLFEVKQYEARTLVVVHSFLHHLRKPFHESLNPLFRAHQIGFEIGDIEYAMLAAVSYTGMFMFCGLNLIPLQDDMKSFEDVMTSYKQSSTVQVFKVYHQCVLNLMGKSAHPTVLTGEVMIQEVLLKEATESKNVLAVHVVWFLRMLLSYYFHDLELAAEMAANLWTLPKKVDGTVFSHSSKVFFRALVALGLFRKTGQRKHMAQANALINRIDQLVKLGDLNCHTMLLILNAEKKITTGNGEEVKRAFDVAIATANRTGFIDRAALANERAGIYFFGLGDMDYARSYLTNAAALYGEWGAQAKVDHLHATFPILSAAGYDSGESVYTSNHLGRVRFNRRAVQKHHSLEPTTTVPSGWGFFKKGSATRSIMTLGRSSLQDSLFSAQLDSGSNLENSGPIYPGNSLRVVLNRAMSSMKSK